MGNSIFFYGSGLFLYIIAAFILPYGEYENIEKNNTNPEKKHEQNKVIAIILIMSGAFLLLRNLTMFFDTRYLWPILLIISGLIIIIRGKEKKDEK